MPIKAIEGISGEDESEGSAIGEEEWDQAPDCQNQFGNQGHDEEQVRRLNEDFSTEDNTDASSAKDPPIEVHSHQSQIQAALTLDKDPPSDIHSNTDKDPPASIHSSSGEDPPCDIYFHRGQTENQSRLTHSQDPACDDLYQSQNREEKEEAAEQTQHKDPPCDIYFHRSDEEEAMERNITEDDLENSGENQPQVIQLQVRPRLLQEREAQRPGAQAIAAPRPYRRESLFDDSDVPGGSAESFSSNSSGSRTLEATSPESPGSTLPVLVARRVESRELELQQRLEAYELELQQRLEAYESQPVVPATLLYEGGSPIIPATLDQVNSGTEDVELADPNAPDSAEGLSGPKGRRVMCLIVMLMIAVAVITVGVVLGMKGESESGAAADRTPNSTFAPTQQSQGSSLVHTVAQEDDLTTLLDVIMTADLVDFLDAEVNGENLTLFAPTNEAFARFDQQLLTKLMQPDWRLHLHELVRIHLIPQTVYADDITHNMTLPTLSLSSFDAFLKFYEDVRASLDGQGAISISSGPSSLTFPAAFSGSNVILTDLASENGLVHKVDQVFLPRVLKMTFLDWVDELDYEFSTNNTLRSLIKTTGLEELASSETSTFFAPYTFGDLFVDHPDLLSDTDRLKALVLNHCVRGVWTANKLTPGLELITLANKTLKIGKKSSTNIGQGLEVNGVGTMVTDVITKNGVFHIIMGFLAPDDLV